MSYERAVALGVAAAVLSLLGAMSTSPGAEDAGAAGTTTSTTLFSTANAVLSGEGGQFDQPWWDAITASSPPWDNTGGGDPVQFDYSTDMDQGREDLVTGQADFAISEGPLTGGAPLSSLPDVINPTVGVFQNEAGTAALNGLTVAYVPIAVEAVAIPFIVVTSCSTGTTLASNPFNCTLQSTINMSPTTLETAFQSATQSWSTPAIMADNNGQGFNSIISSEGPFPSNPQQADATNGALINYFLGTDAQPAWTSWAESFGSPGDTTLYTWPKKSPISAGNQFQESDMIYDLVPRDPYSLSEDQTMQVWGDPYNMTVVPWSWTLPKYTLYTAPLPDISIENAAGAFVAPDLASMEAAFSYASANASNLVTFGANASDKTAYPSQMMTTDYLEVPLNGLSADKATALAGLIQYLLSSKGQSAICSAGYLPLVQTGLDSSQCTLPTVPSTAAALSSQIVAADNTIVTELEAEATAATSTTSTSTTSTSTTSTSTTSTSTTSTSTTTTSTTTTSTTTTSTTTTTAPTTTTTTPVTTTTTAPTTTTTTSQGATTTSLASPTTATTLTSPASTTLPPSATTTMPASATTTTASPTSSVAALATTTVPASATTTGSLTSTKTTVPTPTLKVVTSTTKPPTTKARPSTTRRRRSLSTTKRHTARTRRSPPTKKAPRHKAKKRNLVRDAPRSISRPPETTGGSSGDSPHGSPALAMTGGGALRLGGLGLGLLALGEASRQALRRRREPDRRQRKKRRLQA